MCGAVSALVQALTGSVYAERDVILHYGKLYLIESACLFEPLYPRIAELHPFNNGFFNNLLAVRD